MNNLYPIPSNGISTGPFVTRVFVIDQGVAIHPDLNSVERVAAFPIDSYGFPMTPVGCWPHATHVAGIIAAADNSQGVVGMLPSVQIISIAMGDTNFTLNTANMYQQAQQNPAFSRDCSSVESGNHGAWTVAGAAAALDMVMQRASKGSAIVNMSFNGFGLFRYGQTLWARMRSVATPRWVEGTPWLNDSYAWYKGSLIVQSAGNNGVGACDYAYESTDPFDGIIVVGGLDETGNRLNPPGGIEGEPFFPGSNQGACVEMWAPSSNIKSTWTDTGPFGNPTSYRSLTGTSMAAPHVAGFAATLYQQNPVESSSRRLEQQVRQHLYTLPSGYQMPSF
jgi:subtilisin family serine protease